MSFFQGQPVKIAISCVEAECLNCQECNSDNFDKCIAIKNAHPHIVTGENNEDLNGTTYIKTIWLHESGQEFAFKVGIMSTKKTDIQEVLAVRGLKHKPNHNFDFDSGRRVAVRRQRQDDNFSDYNDYKKSSRFDSGYQQNSQRKPLVCCVEMGNE